MKRIIILLSVVVLVSGVGLSWSSPSSAFDIGWGGTATVEPDAPHPDFEYLQIDPLTLPIINAGGLTQQVSLMVQLEIDYGQKADIANFSPRLVDAYLQDLYGAMGAGFGLMQGGVVDVQQVKQRLTSVTDKVLGPDHRVHGVLLQVVQQHRKL